MVTLTEASTAAYTNSKALLEEATILFKEEKWARSYFLAVTSAEEFVKSVECACESVSFELKTKRSSEGEHDFNLRRFGLLAISSHTMAIEGWNFFARMSEGRVPTRIYNRDFLKAIMNNFVQGAGKRRNATLYVVFKEGRLSEPVSVTEQDAHEMLELVRPFVSDIPSFLHLTGERLKSDLAMKYAPMLMLGDTNDKRTDQQLLKAIGRFLAKNATPAA